MSYSSKQFAKYLGVELPTFYSWIKKGLVPQSTHFSPINNHGGQPSRLWSDELVQSFDPEKARERGKKFARKRRDTEDLADLFNLVLKTSSAIGA